ncbi:hypothetical protein GCM10017566_40080 [Amycolatopsis bartoniae]|uniref:Pyrrolo-quinoline quinone repeat domain-containing protein n=1 Tax=Amycolatopsis bartoniae TaxID=941986 RepID=A0A8H9IWF4_9PSEU|nr:hypothetical protein GCM10017566_40080 [Amycolatopsis bartoniae]
MLRYVTIAGAACALAAPFLSSGATRAKGAELGWFTAAVVVVVALGFARRRAVRIAAAVLGAIVAVAAIVQLLLDVQGGVPGADAPVLAIGAVAAAIGLTASTSWRVRPAGVLGVVVVAVAALLAPWGAESAATESETRFIRDLPSDPVTERPGGRQWAWQPPSDVTDVVAASYGVVVATADGRVTALEGSDGRENWHYARLGARVDALLPSADGRSVLAAFASKDDSSSKLLVMLDAESGAARFERVVPSVLVETRQVAVGTKTFTIRGDELVGYDVDDGEELWRWSPPEGCDSPFSLAAPARTVVLASLECAGKAGLVALDEVSGHERWRHEVRLSGQDSERLDVMAATTTGGATVWLRIVGRLVAPGSVTSGLFDTETGRLLPTPREPWLVRADAGALPLAEQQDGAKDTALEVVDTATGTTHPVDFSACPVRSAEATTAHTYLRACNDNGRDLTVVVQSWDGQPPAQIPVRLDGSGSLPDLYLVPAPGAIVVAREAHGGTPAPVVGLVG